MPVFIGQRVIAIAFNSKALHESGNNVRQRVMVKQCKNINVAKTERTQLRLQKSADTLHIGKLNMSVYKRQKSEQ